MMVNKIPILVIDEILLEVGILKGIKELTSVEIQERPYNPQPMAKWCLQV